MGPFFFLYNIFVQIFFTSDTHFGHAKIIEYCKRPFSDISHMNEVMIEKWNAVVGPGDTVYHLGDFSMGPKENVNLRKRLNGKVILIKGNHDRKDAVHLAAGFDEIHKQLEIEIDGMKLFLAHIPMSLDPGLRWYPTELKISPPEHFDYFLCGHVHDKWKRQGKIINVGVDVSNFTPLTLIQLLARDDA
jgi:calcineurin-like phosphoesterase family protein